MAVAPKSTIPIWPTYVFAGVAALALYMCFATIWDWWPARTEDLVPLHRETAGHIHRSPKFRLPGRRTALILAGTVILTAVAILAATGRLPGLAAHRSAPPSAGFSVSKSPVATLSDPSGAAGGVTSVTFSPDGKILASGDANGSTYLWNVSSHALIATLSGRSPRWAQR